MNNEKLSAEEVQKRLLEMTKAFHEFCESNNLTYYLIGGSLLGAVRHKGFIPWDDDVDVIMPRSDYEKLITFQKISPDLDVVSAHGDNGYYHPYAYCNIADRKTLMYEEYICKPTGKGLFLDIVPLDGLPDNKTEAIAYGRKVGVWARLLGYNSNTVPPIDSVHNLIKASVVLFSKIFNTVFLINKVEKMAKSFEFENSVYCGQIVNRIYPIQRELRYTEDFKERILADFEDAKLYIPAGYDRILTDLYGDYMTPPPVEQQSAHHGITVVWRLQDE